MSSRPWKLSTKPPPSNSLESAPRQAHSSTGAPHPRLVELLTGTICTEQRREHAARKRNVMQEDWEPKDGITWMGLREAGFVEVKDMGCRPDG